MKRLILLLVTIALTGCYSYKYTYVDYHYASCVLTYCLYYPGEKVVEKTVELSLPYTYEYYTQRFENPVVLRHDYKIGDYIYIKKYGIVVSSNLAPMEIVYFEIVPGDVKCTKKIQL